MTTGEGTAEELDSFACACFAESTHEQMALATLATHWSLSMGEANEDIVRNVSIACWYEMVEPDASLSDGASMAVEMSSSLKPISLKPSPRFTSIASHSTFVLRACTHTYSGM